MIEFSFVIYFHPVRSRNLKQTLRFLERREGRFLSRCELILVCQASMPQLEPRGFASVKTVELGLPLFSHPKMCNVGVEIASSPVVVILDSDRILPPRYFSRILPEVSPGVATSTLNMVVCTGPIMDRTLESGVFPCLPDNKSTDNLFNMKNAWSGNTAFMREDYLKCGGMDEQFSGYGFVDNDMYNNFYKDGNSYRYEKDQEIHLYHPKAIITEGRESTIEEFHIYLLRNSLLYCRKWNKQPPSIIADNYKQWKKYAQLKGTEGTDLWKEIDSLCRFFRFF